MTNICSIPDCGKPHIARGWCIAHYQRWTRNGDPLAGRKTPKERRTVLALIPREQLAEQFEDQYIPEPNSGCWIWLGPSWPSHGRGRLFNGLKWQSASRISYELHVGPIPAGLLICHKCDNGICVNPDHLYAGTSQDNSDDMVRRGRHHSRRSRTELEAAS